MCDINPRNFHHIDGSSNPADCVTRCISSLVLLKNTFLTGPVIEGFPSDVEFQVPNPKTNVESKLCMLVKTEPLILTKPLINLDRLSSFKKLINVTHYVRQFIYKLKRGVNARKSDLCSLLDPAEYSYEETVKFVIKTAQHESFPEVFSYFHDSRSKIVPIITQRNLFLDRSGIIRVKCEFDNIDAPYSTKCPILLHKKSSISDCIIMDMHIKLRHAGVYRLLSSLRREFYIPSGFSTVKRVISSCLICKRLYGRSVKVNQNAYKSYKINPP
jgi:hypothetical protein